MSNGHIIVRQPASSSVQVTGGGANSSISVVAQGPAGPPGPRGPAGIIASPTPPTDHTVIWLDTSGL